MMIELFNICEYVQERIKVDSLTKYNYISTDNMLPNRGGIDFANSLPHVVTVKKFCQGDVLISNIRPYFKKIWYAKFDGGCSNDILVIRAKNKVFSEFLYYILSSDNFFEYSMATSKGTKMPRGDKSAIMNYLVPLVDLNVQYKITNILSILDKKIYINKLINNNLEQLVHLYYTQLISCAQISTLNSLIESIESGKRPKGGAQTIGIPSIGAEKIEKFGIYDYSNEKYISNEFYSSMKKGRVKSGDVLLYKDGAYTGKSSMALNGFPYDKCVVNEHVFLLRTTQSKFQSFLYCCLNDYLIKSKIESLAKSKAAQPGLNQQELKSVEIKLPITSLLIEFEEQVKPLMEMIALNSLQNKKLSDIRDSILPKLMSSELDISKIDL